jgi:hypothetical protein
MSLVRAGPGRSNGVLVSPAICCARVGVAENALACPPTYRNHP